MTHRSVLAWSVLFLFSSAVALNCTSNDTSEFGRASGGTTPCKAGTEKCACATGDTCVAGLACLSSLCVAETPATAGSGGATATASTAASGGGGAAGTGGATVAASSTSATGGAGGATAASSSTVASSTATAGSGGGSSGACGTNVIDDFSSCDANICTTNGRGGMWHTVAAANVSGQTFMVGVPGGAWLDMSCGALTTGGGGGDYAGIGIKLANGGGAYNLSAWSGITLTLESSNNTWLQLVAVDGGVFQSQVIGMAGTSVMHSQPFSSFSKVGGTPGANNLDLTKITDLQVMAADTNGYGFAVHDVTLNN